MQMRMRRYGHLLGMYITEEGKVQRRDLIFTDCADQHFSQGSSYSVSSVLTQGCMRRYDHLLGMYITEGGKVRRLDLIFTIPAELPFCLLGWTGSKQYERFLRQHAADCGMKLNSHRCSAPLGRAQEIAFCMH